MGAANVLRDRACLIFCNGNDSTEVPQQPTSPPRDQATAFACSGKVLNLIEESMRTASVTFSSNKKIKSHFINHCARGCGLFEVLLFAMPISD
jgi:hypothetical protein